MGSIKKNEKNIDNYFTKKIGNTTYRVIVHFSKSSNETLQDKINRLIKSDCAYKGIDGSI